MTKPLLSVLFAFALFSAYTAAQQPSTVTPATTTLSEEQATAFRAAQQSFGAGQWTDAYAKLRPLHDAVPADTLVAKYTAEAAINTGNASYAESILKPLLESAPGDWQARTLLARTAAEAHRDADRDDQLRHLTTLHATTTDTRFRQQTQVLIERDALPAGHLDLFYSLQPWSRYNIYEMARVYNAGGRQTLRITLESSDFDQPLWAKQHPDLAAKGERMFSMDGYSDQPAATPGGQATQTHVTYGFFDGRPSFDTVRDRMIAIASGKGQAPLTKTEGIVPRP